MGKLTNKIFSNIVKGFYEKTSEIENLEEVYIRKNRLCVFVKDEEVGLRLYDVLKSLKDENSVICTHNLTFRVDKYIIDKQNKVNFFSVYFDFFDNWQNCSKIDKLQEMVLFVTEMRAKGYVLDDSIFENEKCNSIASFLSFFRKTDDRAETSIGCLIKHIHYELSEGKDFDEFYGTIVDNHEIRYLSEYPYSLPVISMCYKYYVTHEFSDIIYAVLSSEKLASDTDKCNYLIATKNSIEANYILNENNEDYAIYDSNIKIYHNMTPSYEEFLRDDSGDINNNSHNLIEQITTKIVDFDGNIMGYKFVEEKSEEISFIFDKNFKRQREIIDFMCAMSDYIFDVNAKLNMSPFYGDFNIENSLVCTGNSNFKIINIKDLFNLGISDKNLLKNEILNIFFKLYRIYLNQKYGELGSEEQLLEKQEVKFLSPVIAREFINYVLEKDVDYDVAVEEFYTFLYTTKTSTIKIAELSSGFEHNFYYDSRYEYNPLNTPFLFDYEAEKKYGIKIENGKSTELSDGRRLITFNQSRKISSVKETEISLREELFEKIRVEGDSNVKIVEISEIIYSKKINSENMHNVVGYITSRIEGNLLTDEFLLQLNNRELFKVFGFLFTKFENYYIPWRTIRMDNSGFIFYINLFDEDFEISSYGGSSFISFMINHLKAKGYNKYAFFGLDLNQSNGELKKYFLSLVYSFSAYCEEHDIYYNDDFGDARCPICGKTKFSFVPLDVLEKANVIFEDSYAKHYRVYSKVNLKIYKKSNVDMASLENNVDEIIYSRLNSEVINLGQECFIPTMKAIDENNQFIGYVYNAIAFDDEENDITICSDIENPEKLKNLPRLKSLIRLILQVKGIIANDLLFTNNPLTHVFLSKNHKKQVQIVNVDLLSKNGSLENTIKWTCDYVRKVVASDDSISVDISKDNDLDSILTKLQALSKDMTKYCGIHKMYYGSNKLFCPKCVNETSMVNIKTKNMVESDITKNRTKINEGGESFIYDYDNNQVVKVFKSEVSYDLKSIVIARVLIKKKVLEGINKNKHKYKYIIPKKLLVDNSLHKIFGYVMEKVSGMPLSRLRDKKEVERLGFTRKDVLEILITVGEGIQTLHDNNIFIGDLNGQNILFDAQRNVYFLDFDGMGIDDISPEFCTDGYIDPMSKKNQNITMKDDWYSFAVQAFYYLTYVHPFNGIYYVNENGTARKLEIVERMERRISLLGKHGIKVPAIAEPWEWMNAELKLAFLNIFEGESRESIVPYLIQQYKNLYENAKASDKNIQVNSMFIAKELYPFDGEVVRVINHYAAVYEYYLSVAINNNDTYSVKDIFSTEPTEIVDVLLSDDKEIAFVIEKDIIRAINLNDNKTIYIEESSTNHINHVVNGKTLYYTETTTEGNIIHKIDIMDDGEVKKEKIKFLPMQDTKKLFVKSNSKFILVKKNSEIVDEIYCNSEKLCAIIHEAGNNPKYNIFYDEVTNLYFVVNSEGNGIIINAANGMYRRFNISKDINEKIDINKIDVDSISFDKGIIYIPSQDCMYLINVNGNFATKKMECNIIMTPKSKLFDINAKGFSVLTNGTLYEVRRG